MFELVWWLATIKQVDYGPEITSLTRSEDSFDSEKISFGDLGNYSKILRWNSVIVKWSLNFEDEISLRGVECNTQLVILGMHKSEVC